MKGQDMELREGLKGACGLLLWALVVVTLMVLAGRVPKALAGDAQFWGNYPAEIRAWFPTVMQPGFEDMHDTGHSCCGSTDAFEGRVIGEDAFGNISVQIDDGKGIIDDGTVVEAPKSKIQTHYGNPTGTLVVFISVGDHKTVYCLIPLPGL